MFLADIPASQPNPHPYIPLLWRAYAIASQARIGVYDCLYVAVAERVGCRLVTADDRLVRTLQPTFPFITSLSAPPCISGMRSPHSMKSSSDRIWLRLCNRLRGMAMEPWLLPHPAGAGRGVARTSDAPGSRRDMKSSTITVLVSSAGRGRRASSRSALLAPAKHRRPRARRSGPCPYLGLVHHRTDGLDTGRVRGAQRPEALRQLGLRHAGAAIRSVRATPGTTRGQPSNPSLETQLSTAHRASWTHRTCIIED